MPQTLHSTFENILTESYNLPIESVVFSYVKYIVYNINSYLILLILQQLPTYKLIFFVCYYILLQRTHRL